MAREFITLVIKRYRLPIQTVIGISALNLVLYLIIGVAHASSDEINLIDDPAYIAELPFYTGAASHLGVLLWWSSATIAGFSSLLISGNAGGYGYGRFLLAFSAVSAWLSLDDLFMLHEELGLLLANIAGRGELDRHYGEAVVYMLYAGMFLAFIIRFRSILFTTQYSLLILAIASIGASVVVDIAVTVVAGLPDFRGYPLMEEFFKTLGILFWLAYSVNVSVKAFGRSART